MRLVLCATDPATASWTARSTPPGAAVAVRVSKSERRVIKASLRDMILFLLFCEPAEATSKRTHVYRVVAVLRPGDADYRVVRVDLFSCRAGLAFRDALSDLNARVS